MSFYGKEVIIDLHKCNSSKFTRKSIKEFFIELCKVINMERCKLCWWDDQGVPEEEKQTEPHLKGTSAVQFIKTSNMVIHTLDLLEAVYLNVFSCKDFNGDDVREFSKKWFNGKVANYTEVIRK
jgi:S-adenosylmethionine/arginine decarboxylase-like enzyme